MLIELCHRNKYLLIERGRICLNSEVARLLSAQIAEIGAYFGIRSLLCA